MFVFSETILWIAQDGIFCITATDEVAAPALIFENLYYRNNLSDCQQLFGPKTTNITLTQAPISLHNFPLLGTQIA